jgi:hypothetical protein
MLNAGETAEKTMKVIQSARGATLLVDEAYQLSPGEGGRDFGREAVEAIMGTIEGSDAAVSDRPAFIFAGYPREMDTFLLTNSGLRRRVTDKFIFADYVISELFLIFVKMASKYEFTVQVKEAGAVEEMKTAFPKDICSKYNAGISREIFVASKSNVNARLFASVKLDTDKKALKSALMIITNVDFSFACETVKRKLAQ